MLPIPDTEGNISPDLSSAKYAYTRIIWLWTEARSVLWELSQFRQLFVGVRLSNCTTKVRVMRTTQGFVVRLVIVAPVSFGFSSAIKTKASHLLPNPFDEQLRDSLRLVFRLLGFGIRDSELLQEFLHLVFQVFDSVFKAFDTL